VYNQAVRERVRWKVRQCRSVQSIIGATEISPAAPVAALGASGLASSFMTPFSHAARPRLNPALSLGGKRDGYTVYHAPFTHCNPDPHMADAT